MLTGMLAIRTSFGREPSKDVLEHVGREIILDVSACQAKLIVPV